MHMYSTDARAMCIKAYIQMKSLRKTSTLTGVSKSTIQRWATANPIVLRSQKARKATTEAVQRIVQLVSSHPFDTPAKIATRIHDELKHKRSKILDETEWHHIQKGSSVRDDTRR